MQICDYKLPCPIERDAEHARCVVANEPDSIRFERKSLAVKDVRMRVHKARYISEIEKKIV